jgi:hypothetical protein
MTAQPADRIPASGPDTGSYEVIHLGGQAAVVVPVSDFLRLRPWNRPASAQELEDAEDNGSAGGLACPGGRRADLIRSARRGAAAARPSRVNRQIVWETQAIDQVAGFLHDDPDGVRECSTRSRGSLMIPALPGRTPVGHLTDGGCESAATG